MTENLSTRTVDPLSLCALEERMFLLPAKHALDSELLLGRYAFSFFSYRRSSGNVPCILRTFRALRNSRLYMHVAGTH